MDSWLDEFEHPAVTDDNREAFNAAMSKYGSQEAAIVGGFNAQKVAGKPFKLPESLDKLPDDKVRGEFTAQAHKLLGIEHAANVEALADLDMRAGLAEGQEPDENLGNAFKEFVVEHKVPKAIAQKALNFHNLMMAQARAAEEAAKVKAANDTMAALSAHPDFGSEAKVKEQSELFRRAIQNQAGLTAEEYEEFGDALVEGGLNRNAVMARALLKLVAPLAAEGTSESGRGGTPPPKEGTIADDLPKTAKALRWNE